MKSEDARALVDKLGAARNMVCFAEIAAANSDRLAKEQSFPVTATLRVALDMIDDVLEAMGGKEVADADWTRRPVRRAAHALRPLAHPGRAGPRLHGARLPGGRQAAL